MVTLILGQTLIFWSGIIAGIIFAALMLTCSVNLRCMSGACSDNKRKRLYGRHANEVRGSAKNRRFLCVHKYFVWLSIAAIVVHAFLAVLSSLFHVWI